MLRDKLVVFIKAPRPGMVKTRLAASIGVDAACAAYRSLAETVLARVSAIDGLELRYTPEDAYPDVSPWLQPSWTAAPQGSGDLGERLIRAFDDSFASGAERVVIIGSDCPDLETADVRDAWRALLAHDVVLGPAVDGGYWLVGLRRGAPTLFRGIAWSSSAVLKQTLQRAAAAHLRVHLLRMLRDVDTVEDWQRWQHGKPGGEKNCLP